MQKKWVQKRKILANLNSCAKDNEVDPMFAPISIKIKSLLSSRSFFNFDKFFSELPK